MYSNKTKNEEESNKKYVLKTVNKSYKKFQFIGYVDQNENTKGKRQELRERAMTDAKSYKNSHLRNKKGHWMRLSSLIKPVEKNQENSEKKFISKFNKTFHMANRKKKIIKRKKTNLSVMGKRKKEMENLRMSTLSQKPLKRRMNQSMLGVTLNSGFEENSVFFQNMSDKKNLRNNFVLADLDENKTKKFKRNKSMLSKPESSMMSAFEKFDFIQNEDKKKKKVVAMRRKRNYLMKISNILMQNPHSNSTPYINSKIAGKQKFVSLIKEKGPQKLNQKFFNYDN